MAVKREKVHFETVEELLGAPIEKDATTEVRIDQIFPFENHPFKVLDDDKMDDLVQSIKDNGVLTPVLLRPDDEGTYEMISGHRRMHAAKLAGLVTIPAIIKPMTNDEATIAMVDANVQPTSAEIYQAYRVDTGDPGLCGSKAFINGSWY